MRWRPRQVTARGRGADLQKERAKKLNSPSAKDGERFDFLDIRLGRPRRSQVTNLKPVVQWLPLGKSLCLQRATRLPRQANFPQLVVLIDPSQHGSLVG